MKDFNRISLNIPRRPSSTAISNAVEHIQRRPLLLPSLLLFMSCLLTYNTLSAIPMCIISSVLIMIAVAAMKHRQETAFGCFFSLILAILCSVRIISVLNVSAPEGTVKDVSGVIVSCEYKLSGANRITASIDGIRAELRFDKEFKIPNLSPGDSFNASGKFKEPVSAGNPGEFDYRNYLKSKGIKYQFYADSFVLGNKSTGFYGFILSFPEKCFSIREYLLERFSYGRPKGEKGLLAAVCLGDSSLADEDTIRDFRLSGCSHLLAVSGTHFAGFLAALPYILGAFFTDRRKSTLVYVVFASLTACITGWSESVTRAAFMSSCAFSGRDTVSAMSAAAIVMLAADPFCSVRSAFLLSFAACISIRLLSGKLLDVLAFLKEKRGLAMTLGTQAAALIGLMPFSGITQNRFTIVQFFIQPAGGILAKSTCIMFIPGTLLSLLVRKDAAQVLSAPTFLFLDLLRKTVGYGSEYTLSAYRGKPVESYYVISIWMILVLMLMPQFAFRKTLIKISAFNLAVCSGLFIAGIVNPPCAEVVFADVGQGDCCLVIAGKTTCLIDCGTFEEGKSAVSDLLDYYGIECVDMAFMTHWDQDHAGGFAALEKAGRIKRIYTGFTGFDSDTEAFEKSVSRRGCNAEAFRKILEATKTGDMFEFSDKVRFEVIYPDKQLSGGNPGSLVILLYCNGKEILFTGDIGFETEELLVSGNKIHDIDILKVSHHGSKYASSSGFLQRTLPEYSVISVGRNNLYGHPAPATMERLNAIGNRVFRTDRVGAVIIEF